MDYVIRLDLERSKFNVSIESCLWSFHFAAQLVIEPCFLPVYLRQVSLHEY